VQSRSSAKARRGEHRAPTAPLRPARQLVDPTELGEPLGRIGPKRCAGRRRDSSLIASARIGSPPASVSRTITLCHSGSAGTRPALTSDDFPLPRPRSPQRTVGSPLRPIERARRFRHYGRRRSALHPSRATARIGGAAPMKLARLSRWACRRDPGVADPRQTLVQVLLQLAPEVFDILIIVDAVAAIPEARTKRSDPSGAVPGPPRRPRRYRALAAVRHGNRPTPRGPPSAPPRLPARFPIDRESWRDHSDRAPGCQKIATMISASADCRR